METPDVHAHAPHGTGIRWIDLSFGLGALFASFVSLWIAVQNGHDMNRLVQANSLPYLQLYQSTEAADGTPRLALVVSNQGVGPGEIRTAELLVDGKPQPDLDSALAACCGVPARYAAMRTSTLFGRMLRPGENLEYMALPATAGDQAAAKAFKEAMADRIETRICFCSVFDECWATSNKAEGRPTPVAQCSAPKLMYRQ